MSAASTTPPKQSTAQHRSGSANRSNTPNRLSSALITLAGLFVVQGLFLASSYRAWGVISTVLGLTIGLVFLLDRCYPGWLYSAKPFRVDPFWSTVTIIIGLMAIAWFLYSTRFAAFINEGGGPVYAAFDAVAHFFFFSALFLWVLYPRRGHVLMLFFGLATTLLCMSVGGVSRSVPAQTSVGVMTCVGFLLASRIVIPARSQKSIRTGARRVERRLKTSSRGQRGFSRRRYQSLVVVTVLLMMVTGALANATNALLPNLQDLLLTKLQDSIEGQEINSNIGGFRYVNGSQLGAIGSALLSDESGIALRVSADEPPGYLRGKVFDRYENRSWFAKAEQLTDRERRNSTMQNRVVRSSRNGRSRFSLTSAEPDQTAVTTMSIRGEPFRGDQIFLPLGARWIGTNSQGVIIDHHGQIVGGVDNSARYEVGVSRQLVEEELSAERRETCLSVGARYQQRIRTIANDVCRGAKTPREKAAAISNHFRDHFSYSLDFEPASNGDDPIAYFLETRHEAHCEYFASATTLMLRTVGVPTRYVTGYVVDTADSLSDSFNWVALNKDAHAWVEAYDDQTNQWFPVESTPGRAYFSIEEDETRDVERSASRSVVEEVQERALSWLQRSLAPIFSIRATDTIYQAFRWIQIVALIAMVGWLVRRFRGNDATAESPEDRRSRKLLAKVDRKMKRLGYVRSINESLYRFADRIESEAALDDKVSDADPVLEAAAWFRRYADARYQGGQAPVGDL